MYNFDFSIVANDFRFDSCRKFFVTLNVIIKLIVECEFFFTTATVEFDFRCFNEECFYFIVVIIVENFVLSLFFMISFFRMLMEIFFR